MKQGSRVLTQVMSAARAALSGSLESVHATLESIRSRLQVMAMIDSLDQLKRSGRVSWMRSSLGSLLRVKLTGERLFEEEEGSEEAA